MSETISDDNIQNVNTEGQGKRQKNEVAIQDEVTRLCPIEYHKLVAILSYKMHLAPDTIKYSFLSVLFNIGYITNDRHNVVHLKGTEPQETQESQELPNNEEKSELPNGLKPNPHLDPDPESLADYAKKHPRKPEQPENKAAKADSSKEA